MYVSRVPFMPQVTHCHTGWRFALVIYILRFSFLWVTTSIFNISWPSRVDFDGWVLSYFFKAVVQVIWYSCTLVHLRYRDVAHACVPQNHPPFLSSHLASCRLCMANLPSWHIFRVPALGLGWAGSHYSVRATDPYLYTRTGLAINVDKTHPIIFGNLKTLRIHRIN